MCAETKSQASADKGGRVDEEAGRAPDSSSGCISQGFATNLVLSLLTIIAICAIIMVSELGSVVHSEQAAIDALSMNKGISVGPYGDQYDNQNETSEPVVTTTTAGDEPTTDDESGSTCFLVPDDLLTRIDMGENICDGKKPNLPSTDCIVDSMVNVGPQAGANVTHGYQGQMNVTEEPILVPFWQVGVCPVNVHWHIGAEHLSVGEYDETGVGPEDGAVQVDGREGHRCKLYDANDARFTKPYEWKYCQNMEVGETYEVHWPHSAAGACGTPNQYQTPFYDGVFCIDGVLSDTASQIGVQAQVFTVINDDTYYVPDLIRGMVVDGDMGQDVAKYTGSTTGDSVNNEICSQYTPITWQVDRKCHLISASSFDKLCYDMLQQRDDMSDDLHPHGSRETVSDELAANNQHDRVLDESGPMCLVAEDLVTRLDLGENICDGKKPDLPNTDCIVDSMVNVGPQAGANVTQGYQGLMNVTEEPILVPFWRAGMCPVNVHWHIGAEHLSVGEYDETGVGPEDDAVQVDGREGHRCKLYDANDARFTKPYEWKYCQNMEVGETYEVHWPHSAAGACGTPNQYQTPFYDGVFCVDGVLDDTASQIGVQAQVFTVINDDTYYVPDLIRGMVVDGDMGQDVAKYTGSTTGDKVNNEICSQYTPITWQVDRKCHLISASSFDKLCYDMLQQRDDMSDDLHPHGSRETVSDELAANNQHVRFLRAGST